MPVNPQVKAFVDKVREVFDDGKKLGDELGPIFETLLPSEKALITQVVSDFDTYTPLIDAIDNDVDAAK